MLFESAEKVKTGLTLTVTEVFCTVPLKFVHVKVYVVLADRAPVV